MGLKERIAAMQTAAPALALSNIAKADDALGEMLRTSPPHLVAQAVALADTLLQNQVSGPAIKPPSHCLDAPINKNSPCACTTCQLPAPLREAALSIERIYKKRISKASESLQEANRLRDAYKAKPQRTLILRQLQCALRAMELFEEANAEASQLASSVGVSVFNPEDLQHLGLYEIRKVCVDMLTNLTNVCTRLQDLRAEGLPLPFLPAWPLPGCS
ncbi:MAG: hypothetical protein KKD89_07140 [Candidatus Omnitrophica bacterium]|nr:hypothetical protein [Candidatus Omnitrophota bacterium]